MKGFRAVTVLGPLALAGLSAEVAVRLLTPRDPVLPPDPVDIRDHFSAEEIARGRGYARPQLAISLAHSVFTVALLTGLVRRQARHDEPPPQPDPDPQPDPQPQPEPDPEPAEAPASDEPGTPKVVAKAAAAGAAFSLATTVTGLPFAALARSRSLKVGLATQSWSAWASDQAKVAAIESVMLGGGAAAVTAAARRWPKSWWMPAAAGSFGFGTLLATLAPIVLDPLFNDFTPLPGGETRADVLDLAQQANVKIGEVFKVDASRRTTAANAYVTGLGPTKRVVLFDTLLDRYTRDEVRAVVAHELAHVRNRDVPRLVAFGALTAPATTFAVQRLSWAMSPQRATSGALPALALAGGLVSMHVSILASRLSRAVERRADDFALRQPGAPKAFVAFERTIALQNVADIDPPRITRLIASHPPAAERIGAALAHARAERHATASDG